MSDYNPYAPWGPLFGVIHGTSGRRIHIVKSSEPYEIEAFCGQYLSEVKDRDEEAQAALLAGLAYPPDVASPEKVCDKCRRTYAKEAPQEAS